MALDRASSQSALEQHKRLAQQHNQAKADALADYQGKAKPGNKPRRTSALQTLPSVREEDPTATAAERNPAQYRDESGTAPTGTYAAVPLPAGVARKSSGSRQGSRKRISSKPVHYGMVEKSQPLPVLSSPFSAVNSSPVEVSMPAPVLSSVDASLQALQNKL